MRKNKKTVNILILSAGKSLGQANNEKRNQKRSADRLEHRNCPCEGVRCVRVHIPEAQRGESDNAEIHTLEKRTSVRGMGTLQITHAEIQQPAGYDNS